MHVNVFLLSGGTRVAVHVGALRAIEEAGAQVASWAGVSAGSLVAAVRACGYSQEEAFDLMLHTDYRRFQDARPWSLFRGYGLFAGNAFESWLDDVLEGRRFEDLFTPLTVVATDVASGEAALFSQETTPDVKIATAVRCSIAIPGVFAARRINGRAFVDGCLARVEPEMLFPGLPHPTVMVRMEGSGSQPSQTDRLSLAAYVRRVTQLISDSIDGLPVQGDWDYDLRVDVGHCPGICFGQTPAEKQALHDSALEQCRRMLPEADSDSGALRHADTHRRRSGPNSTSLDESTVTDRLGSLSMATAYY